tara:strand:- start:1218 stop:1400 length:183 start_codon:yes stop_codon:yes gene_type:complete
MGSLLDQIRSGKPTSRAKSRKAAGTKSKSRAKVTAKAPIAKKYKKGNIKPGKPGRPGKKP